MIFVTGDMHGNFKPLYDFADEETVKLTKKDFVIILGDFGVWNETIENIRKLDKELPFTILFIDGNHENFPLLESTPKEEKFGGTVHNLYGVFHLCRGEIFEMPNESKITTIAVCGGADSSDKDLRSEGIDWFQQEKITEDDIERLSENSKRYNMKVDYFLSHCPTSIVKLELAAERRFYVNNIDKFLPSDSEYRIRNIIASLKAKAYICGHEHIDREFCIEKKKYILVSSNFIKLN